MACVFDGEQEEEGDWEGRWGASGDVCGWYSSYLPVLEDLGLVVVRWEVKVRVSGRYLWWFGLEQERKTLRERESATRQDEHLIFTGQEVECFPWPNH